MAHELLYLVHTVIHGHKDRNHMHLVIMKADFFFFPGFLNFLRQNLGIMGVCYIYKGKEGIEFLFVLSGKDAFRGYGIKIREEHGRVSRSLIAYSNKVTHQRIGSDSTVSTDKSSLIQPSVYKLVRVQSGEGLVDLGHFLYKIFFAYCIVIFIHSFEKGFDFFFF